MCVCVNVIFQSHLRRQPVDPVVGDPVRQDNDKISILGSFVPPSVYLNREFPYIFVYCFSCRYLVELGL